MADQEVVQLLQQIAAGQTALLNALTGKGTAFGQAEMPVTSQSDMREDWLIAVFSDQIAANGTSQQSRIISQDGHFDLIYITGRSWIHSTDPAARLGQPNLELKIHDGGSDRYLTEGGRFIHWTNLIGATPTVAIAAVPGYLATPNAPYTLAGRRRFPVSSLISLEVHDLSGVATDYEIAFHGIKTFVTK